MTMSSHPLRYIGLLALLASVAVSWDAVAQDSERGRRLYENHCRGCHTEQVHGRRNRSALSVAELRAIVDQWQRNQKLRWSREDIDDVVHYLGSTRYFLLSQPAR
jgi:mono/diheme cytochrome c family protein